MKPYQMVLQAALFGMYGVQSAVQAVSAAEKAERYEHAMRVLFGDEYEEVMATPSWSTWFKQTVFGSTPENGRQLMQSDSAACDNPALDTNCAQVCRKDGGETDEKKTTKCQETQKENKKKCLAGTNINCETMCKGSRINRNTCEEKQRIAANKEEECEAESLCSNTKCKEMITDCKSNVQFAYREKRIYKHLVMEKKNSPERCEVTKTWKFDGETETTTETSNMREDQRKDLLLTNSAHCYVEKIGQRGSISDKEEKYK